MPLLLTLSGPPAAPRPARVVAHTHTTRKPPHKPRAQVVLRWHVEQGVVAIRKSVKTHRNKENIGVFDLELTPTRSPRSDALDNRRPGGPDPETHTSRHTRRR